MKAQFFLIMVLLSAILVSSQIMKPKDSLIFHDSPSSIMKAMEKLIEIVEKRLIKDSSGHKEFYNFDQDGNLLVDGILANLNRCTNILNVKNDQATVFCDLVKYLKENNICGAIYDESIGGIWMFKYKCNSAPEDFLIILKTDLKKIEFNLEKFGLDNLSQVDDNEYMVLLITDYN